MLNKKVAVVGAGGMVGGHMYRFLLSKQHFFEDVYPYDVAGPFAGICTWEHVNSCDIVFVCVPTPEKEDGHCDISIVEDVCSRLQVPMIVIRSTVRPGTCETLANKLNKNIIFQPEYLGENPSGNRYNDIGAKEWVILGGDLKNTSRVADFYLRIYPSSLQVFQTDFRTAEMVKYMTNSFLAMKTVYCNEMARIAAVHGVDYNVARELWLMDDRIGRSHTCVYKDEPGYGGKCFPKDVKALIESSKSLGYEAELLTAVDKVNDKLREHLGY